MFIAFLALLFGIYLTVVGAGYLFNKLSPFIAQVIEGDKATGASDTMTPARFASYLMTIGSTALILIFQMRFHCLLSSVLLGSVIGAIFYVLAVKRGADTVNPVLAGWFVAFMLLSGAPLFSSLVSVAATFLVYAALTYGVFDIRNITKDAEGADADATTIVASVIVSPVILWNKIIEIYKTTSLRDLGIRFC